MANQTDNLYNRPLQLLDELQYVLYRCLNNEIAQNLEVLYGVGIVVIGAALLAYWLYCATLLAAAPDTRLTEADVAPMRWRRRCLAHLHGFLMNGRWMAL